MSSNKSILPPSISDRIPHIPGDIPHAPLHVDPNLAHLPHIQPGALENTKKLVARIFKPLVSNHILTYSAVAVAVASGVYTFLSFQKAKETAKQAKLRRVVRGWVTYSFTSRQHDIFNYLLSLPNMHFTAKDLATISSALQPWIKNHPNRGILAYSDFLRICASAGLTDTIIADSLWRFFDVNHVGSLDFIDLVLALNLSIHGTRAEKVERFFDVLDLDEDGYITAHEMHSVLHATQHQRFTIANTLSQAESTDDKELREKITKEVKENATINHLFSVADSNHDNRLTRSEFAKLADCPEVEFKLAPQLLSMFGF